MRLLATPDDLCHSQETVAQERLSARLRIGPQGRVVIPVEMREALGMSPGTVVAMHVEGRRLVIERPEDILSRLRDELRAAVPAGTSVVDELIEDRRADARREQAEHDSER